MVIAVVAGNILAECLSEIRGDKGWFPCDGNESAGAGANP